MADFNIAYLITAKHEGGYANVPGDNGGETYKGISRVFNPRWAGWPIIDTLKRTYKNGVIPRGTIFNNAALNEQVKQFYYTNYWLAQAKGNRIQNQEVANFMYDFVVNSGLAEREINKAINKALGTKLNEKESQLTDEAILLINSYPGIVYPAMVKQRESYVRSLADFATFGKGWLKRIASFPAQLSGFVSSAVSGDKKKG
jgi:lysozyme family protein